MYIENDNRHNQHLCKPYNRELELDEDFISPLQPMMKFMGDIIVYSNIFTL